MLCVSCMNSSINTLQKTPSAQQKKERKELNRSSHITTPKTDTGAGQVIRPSRTDTRSQSASHSTSKPNHPGLPSQPASQTDRQTNPISFAPCQPKIRHRPMFSIPKWKPSSRTKGSEVVVVEKKNFKLCRRRKS